MSATQQAIGSIGWKPEPVAMGGYDDFAMTDPASGRPMAGVCHQRGSNQGLPRSWLVYDPSGAVCALFQNAR